ncbi:MAG: hypothetical protein IPO53_10000 [Chitinophagaceae bacterium]|nr:hypothetical protein [Chitinophagaceae bacterium]
MKKFLLLTTLISFVVLDAAAQSLESIKTELAINQFKKAKEDIDKAMSNTKFASKAEAYILKTTIYAGLAMDDATKNTSAGDQLTSEAEAAFKKYREMEPAMTLINDPIYQNGPINLYASYYSSGYQNYQTKNWPVSFEKLKKAVEMSDLLISKKVLTMTLDTNVLILAGIAAENNSNKDEAVKYYGRLADNKITGDGFESVYRYLVSYYFGKKDLVSFEKYKALGEELFPKSDYFKYDKIDFAIGLEETFDAKVKAVEEVLATDPNNYKANEILGELIYDTLNSSHDGAVLPSNAAELEKKMIDAFSKSAIAKPGSEIPFLYMGDHNINKAVRVNAAREAHATDMKTRTKPGTMASKEDIAKRDLLDKQYGEALESARDPYEKAAAIFSTKPKSTDKNQDIRDHQQYRKVASYLADVYAYKKIQSKSKPTEMAKYAAEEKKWNDLYDSIK